VRGEAVSAYVVSKRHVDLLVRAALAHGADGCRMQWWQVDADGEYDGWRIIDADAERRRETHEASYWTPSMVGQMLVSANVLSVVCLYPDTDPSLGDLPGPVDAYYVGPYVYEDPGRVPSSGETFRLIDQLDYQACEYDGWRRSEPFMFQEALRQRACRNVDGYDDLAPEVFR
jgi:hypothetical protein